MKENIKTKQSITDSKDKLIENLKEKISNLEEELSFLLRKIINFKMNMTSSIESQKKNELQKAIKLSFKALC